MDLKSIFNFSNITDFFVITDLKRFYCFLPVYNILEDEIRNVWTIMECQLGVRGLAQVPHPCLAVRVRY